MVNFRLLSENNLTIVIKFKWYDIYYNGFKILIKYMLAIEKIDKKTVSCVR